MGSLGLANRQERHVPKSTLTGARAARSRREVFVQADSDLLELAVVVAGRPESGLGKARIRGSDIGFDLGGTEL